MRRRTVVVGALAGVGLVGVAVYLIVGALNPKRPGARIVGDPVLLPPATLPSTAVPRRSPLPAAADLPAAPSIPAPRKAHPIRVPLIKVDAPSSPLGESRIGQEASNAGARRDPADASSPKPADE